MTKADRNDEWGIKHYGAEKWARKCDYEDNKNERKERVFSEVTKPENMNALFALINNLVGEDMKFSYTVDEARQKFSIKSEVDLSDKPFICLAWKEFRVESFAGGVCTSEPYYDEENDYTKPVADVFYRLQIHYAYSHIGGGTNGASIASASFSEDGKWTFKTDMEMYKD